MNKITNKKEQNGGFTLIEILVVIGIIAVLAAIVLIAINPAKQFAQARDTERRSNVTAILDGVGQYIADNQGEVPPSITDAVADIDDALCDELVPEYLPAMPTDPTTDLGDIADCSDLSGESAGYTVVQDDTTKRITVAAPDAEDYDPDDDGNPDPITITR